jgi:hypothetical protein
MVDIPGGEAEVKARTLVREGLASATEREFVRCSNAGDPDIAHAVDRTCLARVFVPEDEYDPVWCPRCDRKLEPRRKQRFAALILQPNVPAIGARLCRMLDALDASVREGPPGVLRIERGGSATAVVFLDACDERTALSLVEQGAIAVAANHGQMAWRMPPGRTLLSAADLLLSSPQPLLDAVRGKLEGDSVVLLVPPPAPAKPSRPAPRFPLPPGAGWNDVTIYFVDGATVGICIPASRPVHASAVDLGMAKDKARVPSRMFTLLVHLCLHRGKTDWQSARRSETHTLVFDNYAAFRMQANGLRRQLQQLFGLQGDPYATFGERRPLVTAFRALPEAPGRVDYERRVS